MKLIGIIGAGKIADIHYQSIIEFKNFKISGVYDINENKSKDFTKKYNLKKFNNINKLCEDSDILIICSDNSSHFKNIKVGIKNNCIILCEKPLVLNLNEYNLIEKLLKKSHSKIYIGFNYRQLEIIKKLSYLCQKNKLNNIKFNFFKNSNLSKTKKSWKDYNYTKGTGGVVGDLGIHLIDLYSYINKGRENNINIKKIVKYSRSNSLSKKIEESASLLIKSCIRKINLTINVSKISETNEFEINADFEEFTFSYKSSYKNYYLIKKDQQNWIRRKFKALKVNDPLNETYGWSDSFRNQIHNLDKLLNNNKSNLCSFKDYKFHQELLDKLLRYKVEII